MTDNANPEIGRIVWTDLTVPNAEEVRDFYQQVVGWEPSDVDQGGYQDYNMLLPDTGEPAAGIVHAAGPNADLPPQWLIYITVADLDVSIAACLRLGGKLVAGPKAISTDRYCVVQDPAGAVVALYQK